MEKAKPFPVRVAPDSSSLFDGFPYLSTRICTGLYHITLLPRKTSEAFLLGIASVQCFLNQLITFAVIAADESYRLTPNGDHSLTSAGRGIGPTGGVLTLGWLRPLKELPYPAELDPRHKKLADFGNGPGRKWSLFGDLTKGGHDASEDELRRLAGQQANGVPAGLAQCSKCGEWKGECLDPSPTFTNRVMTVHCTCDNENQCAGCGHLLHERKLNANYFNEADGIIWHVPGFSAFRHRCERGLQ